MSFVAALDTIKVVLEGTLHGHDCANIFHVRKSSAVDVTDLGVVGALFHDWWSESWGNQFSSDYSLNQIDLRDLTVPDGVSTVFTSGLPLLGSRAFASMNNSIALVMTWRSAFAGRSNRGRTYMPAIPGNVLVGENFVDATYANLVRAAGQDLIDRLAATIPYRLVVASYRNETIVRPTAVMTEVLNCTVNTKLDNQRRRMKGAS